MSIQQSLAHSLLAPAFILLLSACSKEPPQPPALQSANDPQAVGDQPTDVQAPNLAFISWREHLIDTGEDLPQPLSGGDGLAIGDLDGDARFDIVSVHESDTEYDGEADGYIRIAFGTGDREQWVNVTLAEGPEAGAPEDVDIADVNGDGHLDIIASAELAHLIYFQNPGENARTQPWERVIIPATLGRGSFIRVFFGDFDGDGRVDVSTANKGEQNPDPNTQTPTSISVFHIGEDPLDGESWTETVLGEYLIPQNAQPVDIDGDGDLDIIGGVRVGPRLVLFRNTDGAFEEIPINITGAAMGGFNLAFADFNDDGRMDIVSAVDSNGGFANGAGWIEQPADLAKPWAYHHIGTFGPDWMIGLALADIDGDRDLDLLSGGYSRGPRDHDEDLPLETPMGRLGWFENPGEAATPWKRHDISRRERGMYDKFIPYDMDNDGDMDFLGTRGNSDPYDGVYWLEQVRTGEPVKVFTPARKTDSPEMPLAPNDAG